MNNNEVVSHRAGFILKVFPSILRSSGSKDTLLFGPETSRSKERAFSPAQKVSEYLKHTQVL